MALPDELLDELLSAYLDGAASRDECARVEQLLHEDPAIAERLEQMRELRSVFQAGGFFQAGGETSAKLPDDFADSVVRAAIERAESESLSESHPLRKAGATAVTPAGGSDWNATKTLMVVAGLAAAVLVIGLVVNPLGQENPGRNNPPLIAQSSDAPSANTPETSDAPEASPGETFAAEESIRIAEAAQPTAGPTGTTSDESLLADSGVGDNPAMTPQPAEQTAPMQPESPTPAVPQANPALAAAAPQPLRMLMVVEVELTDAGRSIGAFNQALNDVQIEIGDERQVSDQLARAAIDQTVDDDTLDQPPPRMLLLESPAKKLDLLVNQLAGSGDNIKSLGFNAITVQSDPSLMKALESVRTDDPTKIRHSGLGSPLTAPSDPLLRALSGQIGDRDFLPIGDAQTAQMVTGAASDNGPDQMANILFLIR